MIYWFKRKYWQVKNVFKWLPIIWNQFDFDYRYSLEAFKFQLEKQAEFMESDKAVCLDSKHYASRIKMVLRLMDKVYNQEYACEYQEQLKKLYGKNVLDWHIVSPHSYLKYNYEYWNNAELISSKKDELFKLSKEKQKRAHKLLWKLIEHNIQSWWD